MSFVYHCCFDICDSPKF
uniref:Uncharacterized protein n=1 Tax=Arundo donax TaxID=35708 RepID=A0A0A9ART2_ARUDO